MTLTFLPCSNIARRGRCVLTTAQSSENSPGGIERCPPLARAGAVIHSVL